MKVCFEDMVSSKELIEMGFKPYQAKQISRECKEYLCEIEEKVFIIIPKSSWRR